jgi:hypothetical protein
MDHFFNTDKTISKEKVFIMSGIYKIIRERILKLSKVNNEKYTDLINNPIINNRIERFLNLENKYYSPDEIYTDVEQATNQEQDV